MAASRYRTRVSGVDKLVSASDTSASAMAGNIVALNAASLVDVSLLPALGGMILLEEHVGSSVANLDFTTFYSTKYDVYQVELVNITSSGAGQLLMAFSSNAGSSFDSTTANYYTTQFYNYGTGTADAGAGGLAGILLAPWASDTLVSTAGTSNTGNVKLHNLTSSSLMKRAVISMVCAGSGSSFEDIRGSALYSAVPVVNALRVFTTSGTFSGTIRVYGLATSSSVSAGAVKVGGLQTATAYKTSSYTTTPLDGNFICDASGASFTMTLPASPNDGEIHEFAKYDSSANSVTVSGNGHNINSGTSASLSTQWQVVKVQYFAAKTLWVVL